VLALAALCLGPARALLSAARAVPQLLVTPTPLVRGLLDLVAAEPFSTALGVMYAKATGFNLLPLGTLAGGGAVREFLRAVRSPREARSDRPSTLWYVASMLVILYVTGRLAWGLVQALR
jgi:Zn-dependent protease